MKEERFESLKSYILNPPLYYSNHLNYFRQSTFIFRKPSILGLRYDDKSPIERSGFVKKMEIRCRRTKTRYRYVNKKYRGEYFKTHIHPLEVHFPNLFIFSYCHKAHHFLQVKRCNSINYLPFFHHHLIYFSI